MIIELVSMLVRYTFVGVIAVGGLVGGFAYYTKPSNEMLRNKISSENSMEKNAMFQIIGKEEIEDWLFVKIATVTVGPDTCKYVGYLNRWHRSG
jgi:hypothetical protein